MLEGSSTDPALHPQLLRLHRAERVKRFLEEFLLDRRALFAILDLTFDFAAPSVDFLRLRAGLFHREDPDVLSVDPPVLSRRDAPRCIV